MAEIINVITWIWIIWRYDVLSLYQYLVRVTLTGSCDITLALHYSLLTAQTTIYIVNTNTPQ